MKLAALLKSKIFLGVTTAVVAASAAAVGLVMKNRPDEYRVIKIHDVKGTTSVTRSAVGALEPYTGMNLESGDEISTRRESTLRMVMDSTKYALMEPETNIELTAAGTAADSKTRITLRSGSVLNEIIEPLSPGSSYEVEAPKATMAVRGTSFRTTVEKDEYGDYVITLFVFHGNVSVQLIDENGKPTGDPVFTVEDKKIIIKTVHNEHSGNDPSVDGKSFFVIPDENGELVPVPEGESPLLPIDYFSLPREVLQQLYDDDNEDSIKLYANVHNKVIEALFGADSEPSDNKNDPSGSGVSDDEEDISETTTVSTTVPEVETLDSRPETRPQTENGGGSAATTTVTTTAVTTTTTTTVPPAGSPSDGNGTVTTTAPAVTSNKPATSVTSPKQAAGGSRSSVGGATTRKTTTTSETETAPPELNEYTVLFYDYDGKLLSEQIVEEGESASAPTDHTKSYTDSDGMTMIFDKWDTDFSNVRADLTVKPTYTAKARFKVTFLDYDGSVLETQTVEQDNDAAEPEGLTKSFTDTGGHKKLFREWDRSFTNIREALTVKPLYDTVYTVTFFDETDEMIGEPQTVTEGESAVAPEEGFSKEIIEADVQKVFVGWDTDFTSVKHDLKIRPVYRQSEQLFLEDMVNGELSSYDYYAIGEEVTLPKPVTVTDGYSVGWFPVNTNFRARVNSPVTTVTVGEGSEENCYILTRYKPFTFSGDTYGEKFSAAGTLFCENFENEMCLYYFLDKNGGEPIDLMDSYSWDDGDVPSVCGIPVVYWSFTVAGEESPLKFEDLIKRIEDSEAPIPITGAIFDATTSDGLIG
ncbi:MAG: FecR domain-containing protein [Ruminococcus sp.]|nr:FecR domain-containing protein [Ruminococcus sp.]